MNSIVSFLSNIPAEVRGHIGMMSLALVAGNVLAWAWALMAFHGYPLMLGTALLAYSFGLRHAVDADHIAAIDNVTRKLMQEGKRPVGVGLFFSLGHSTIVVGFRSPSPLPRWPSRTISMSSRASAESSARWSRRCSCWRSRCQHRHPDHGVAHLPPLRTAALIADEELNMALADRGFLAGSSGRCSTLITRSWQMYPLGFLFGLGFDTATEVGLLGISAATASKGLPIWSILVFPALFTAGMTLVDTTDGILMPGAYGWAFVKPIRKLYYNMTITFVSVLVAVFIGGIEALGLIGAQLKLQGSFWSFMDVLTDDKNFGMIGFSIIGLFVVGWTLRLLFTG